MFPDHSLIRTDTLQSDYLREKNIRLAVLRLDLIHPLVSGNKWFKLKYNLQEARQGGHTTVLTFGGAWSNHLLATAIACKMFSFKSIGIVRGERPARLSPALQDMQEAGMQLHFISRDDYRRKREASFLSTLAEQYKERPYIIPEGGCNEHGIKGCEEILDHTGNETYSHICCACGTGATLAGIIRSALPEQHVLGFAALKNNHLEEEIKSYLQGMTTIPKWVVTTAYHSGGFARTTRPLFEFMRYFYEEYSIPLDIVYTGKMMSGIFDLIRQGFFPEKSSILAIHTGGLQGNRSVAQGELYNRK